MRRVNRFDRWLARGPSALKVWAMCAAVWALGMTTEALAGLISWPIAGLAMLGWAVIFSADYWRRALRDRRGPS